MRNRMALVLGGLLWAWASAVASANLPFGPENPNGVLIKTVVEPEASTLVVVPVNLTERTVGAPIVLDQKPGWVMEAATNRTKETRRLFYHAYALPPGDYAILYFGTEIVAWPTLVKNGFCYAGFSPVLTIRAGEATIWHITAFSLQAWDQASDTINMADRYAQEFSWVRRSIDASPDFRPKALHIAPTAFVDMSGGQPVNVRDCRPRGLQIVDRPLPPDGPA